MKDKFILSRELICSALYLRLSPSAQALYIALHADADDDGIVDALAVMLRQRAAENDLKQLVENNFIVLLDAAKMLVWLRAWIGLTLIVIYDMLNRLNIVHYSRKLYRKRKLYQSNKIQMAKNAAK